MVETHCNASLLDQDCPQILLIFSFSELPMTHDERLQIAREAANRILEKYGEQISAIAIYGSTAKKEDRSHSDLDMWVATSRPIEDLRFFVYKGIAISIAWDTEEA